VEVVCQRCAGIDVSKRDAEVCVRVQGRGSARTTARVSTWSSVMPQILKLRVMRHEFFGQLVMGFYAACWFFRYSVWTWSGVL